MQTKKRNSNAEITLASSSSQRNGLESAKNINFLRPASTKNTAIKRADLSKKLERGVKKGAFKKYDLRAMSSHLPITQHVKLPPILQQNPVAKQRSLKDLVPLQSRDDKHREQAINRRVTSTQNREHWKNFASYASFDKIRRKPGFSLY